MKKTLTINLGGIVYHIDDDAYRLLDNYLSNLKHYFRKQEGAEEIVDDIEMRIAELFAEKVTEGKQVITVSDVEEIIARVGKPEDFGIADGIQIHRKERSKHRPLIKVIRKPLPNVAGSVIRIINCWVVWQQDWQLTSVGTSHWCVS